MGIFKRLFGGIRAKKKVRIVVVGLDHSGKTTVLTVGFTTEEFQKHGINFTAFDMSGQSRYRNLWEHYYGDVEGIIVVIDSTDRLRFAVVKSEMQAMLEDPKVKEKTPRIPILFLANKMDQPTAVNFREVEEALDLAGEIGDSRPWYIAPCDALKGEGLEDGIKWLSSQVNSSA